MRPIRLSIAAAGLALIAGAASPVTAHSLKELEDQLQARERYVEIVHRPAPDFALSDAEGRSVRLSDFKGKVVVLNFIYASCPDVCPLHSEAIATLQEAVNGTPMKDLVRFVSITTDPERDTPAVLKAYGPTHGLDPANWVFLTSGPDRPTATRELAGRYGLKFTAGGVPASRARNAPDRQERQPPRAVSRAQVRPDECDRPHQRADERRPLRSIRAN